MQHNKINKELINKIVQVPISLVAVADLKPYPKNAKKHPQAQIDKIAESIVRYRKFTQPIVIAKDHTIINGHGRVAAAEKIGLEKVPCLKMEDLSEQEARELRIVDNLLAITSMDDGLLLEDLEDLEIELEDFKFNIPDLPEPQLMDEIDLPDDQSKEFETMTFTLTNSQASRVRTAIELTKNGSLDLDTGNENSNGNALSVLCEFYLEKHG